MPVNEEGPGVGFWVSLVIGVLAGAVLGWPIAGVQGFVVAFLVAGVLSAVLLM